MNEEQELKQQSTDNTFKSKTISAYNYRTLATGFAVLMSGIALLVFLAYAQPVLANLFTAPDRINANTTAIAEIRDDLREIRDLRRELSNLNGQVNQLRGWLEGQESTARKLEQSITRIEQVTEYNNRENRIHLDNLRDAIREIKQR